MVNPQHPVTSPTSLSPPISSPTQKEASRRRSFGFLSSSRKTSYSREDKQAVPQAATPSSDTSSPVTPSLTQDSDAKSSPSLDLADSTQPTKASVWYRGKRYTTYDLWQAVATCEIDKAERCIKAGLSIDYCQWYVDGVASITDRAVESRSNGMLAMLLRYQPDMTGSNKARYIDDHKRQYGQKWYNRYSSKIYAKGEPNDWTAPLHNASKLGYLEGIRLLLRDGKVDPNLMDAKARTPLFHAVSSGSTKTLELLLDNGAQIEWTNQMNVTPLHASVIRGDSEMVKKLIKHGALLDKYDSYGETALYDAAIRGHSTIVQQLAEAGADLDIKNEGGISAYFQAASTFDEKTMKMLADYGCDVNCRDNKGLTTLMRAIGAGNKPLAASLLENGLDIDAADNDGWTALDIAMIKRDESLVTLLLLSGASLQTVDAQNNTILHRAAARGTSTLIRHLLAVKSQDPNARSDKTGETPLHLAAAQGNRPATHLLLHYGANPNCTDLNGQTPLHRAIVRGSLAVVRELCNHPQIDLVNASTTLSQLLATLVPESTTNVDANSSKNTGTDLQVMRKTIVRFLQSKGLALHWPQTPVSSVTSSPALPRPSRPSPPQLTPPAVPSTLITPSILITNPAAGTNNVSSSPYDWDKEANTLLLKRGLDPAIVNAPPTAKPKSKSRATVPVTASGKVIINPNLASSSTNTNVNINTNANTANTATTTTTATNYSHSLPNATTAAATTTIPNVNDLNAPSAPNNPTTTATRPPTTTAASSSPAPGSSTTKAETATKVDPFEASIPAPTSAQMEKVIQRYIMERHGGGSSAVGVMEGVGAGLNIANGILGLLG